MDRKTAIRYFRHNDKFYSHILDLETDNVIVKDKNDITIITYDRSGYITVPCVDKYIGKISMREIDKWYVEFYKNDVTFDQSEKCHGMEALLDFEVEVSKYYLDTLGV